MRQEPGADTHINDISHTVKNTTECFFIKTHAKDRIVCNIKTVRQKNNSEQMQCLELEQELTFLCFRLQKCPLSLLTDQKYSSYMF